MSNLPIIVLCVTGYFIVSRICNAVEHRNSMKAYEEYCYMYRPKPSMDAADFLEWLEEEKKNGKSGTETSSQREKG